MLRFGVTLLVVIVAVQCSDFNFPTQPGKPASCDVIVSRTAWGARVPIQIQYQVLPVRYVIVHHTVTPSCDTETECTMLLKSMQNFHMDTLEYDDIGYNFVVGGDGKVYEAAGFHIAGAHTRGYNTRSLGLAFIGNFNERLPSDKQLQAAKDFLKCAVDLGELDSKYKLLAARKVSATQSPGLRLYRELQSWPHYTNSP